VTLQNQLEYSGRWLFRWRSFLPLIVLAAAIPALIDHRFPAGSHALQEWWNVLCLTVALSGQLLRFYTVGQVPRRTSGRNRREQVAESLNTTGIYSAVRNPLYLGNCLIWLGLAAVPQSLALWLIVALLFWLYHERIILAEEAFLERRFGEEFRQWAAVTPVFLPRFSRWRAAVLPFSFRHALGREYLGAFAIISAFTTVEMLMDSAVLGRFVFPVGWLIAWLLSLVAFLVIRILRKKTRVLQVEGR